MGLLKGMILLWSCSNGLAKDLMPLVYSVHYKEIKVIESLITQYIKNAKNNDCKSKQGLRKKIIY